MAGDGFAGHGLGVNVGLTAHDDAVQRHEFAGSDDDHLADLHGIRPYPLNAVGADHGGVGGLQVHERFDRTAGLVDCTVLEVLPDLVEQHDRDGFGPVAVVSYEADRYRSDGGDRHEEVLVQESSFHQGLPRVDDDIVSHHQQTDEEHPAEDLLPQVRFQTGKGVFEDQSEGDEHKTQRNADR